MNNPESPQYGIGDIACIMTKAGNLAGGDPESVRFALRTMGITSVDALTTVLDDPAAVSALKRAADTIHTNPSTTAQMTAEEFGETLRALFLQVAAEM